MCSVERRAGLARLSLCLLAAVLGAALSAPAAGAAELAAPRLQETNPASPGASLTPRIRGHEEEAQTKVLIPRAPWIASGGTTHALDPTNTVRIYAEAECTGPVLAQRTLGELEAAGILVTVGAESTTIFYATQSNATETSPCSEGLTYRQVSSAPDVPGFTAVNPASPANNNFPRLIGTSADPDATISVYTDAICSGSPVTSGSADEFESFGIEVAVADNSETTFYAKAGLAGFSSACSVDLIAYGEVTPPPAQVGWRPGRLRSVRPWSGCRDEWRW